MEIYFIRHTTPLVEKGICYGQTNLEVTDSFHAECQLLKDQLPQAFDRIYSSPLKRCTILAEQLDSHVITDKRLKEIDFGDWEMKKWNEIPEKELNPWMKDFVRESSPKGESMEQLQARVIEWWEEIRKLPVEKLAVVTHSGVIRIMHAYVNKLPLKNAFDDFKIGYGEFWKFKT